MKHNDLPDTFLCYHVSISLDGRIPISLINVSGMQSAFCVRNPQSKAAGTMTSNPGLDVC